MKKNKRKVSVIGSGIGGLAIAVRLAVNGFDVKVFDSNNQPGGKAVEFSVNGFRFDKGPSLLTMPEKIDELFYIAGKNPADYISYSKMNENCRYFFEDGNVIKGYANPKQFANELHKKENVPRNKTLRFLRRNEFIFNSTNYLFLEKSLHKLKTYLSFRVILSALKIPWLNLFSSMHTVNSNMFSNPKIVQIFNRYATYNGSNPYQAPAVLNSITALEFKDGAFFADKGMSSIAKAIYKLAKEIGVKFYFSSEVDKIKVGNEKVEGIIVGNKVIDSDIVVCNTDIHYVYNKLLPKQFSIRYRKNQERSSSAIIFYWGVNKIFNQLQIHNILFSKDYKSEFDFIKEGNKIYSDPTIYINVSSKKIKSDAPKDSENWFVMINVPNDKGQDWDKIIKQTRIQIINKINRVLKTSIEDCITCESVVDPRSIEVESHSFKGALYGTSSNTKQSAFFRHPNFSIDIKGLYFCGGSVHPGGGIPLVLSSAKIVEELINSDYERK